MVGDELEAALFFLVDQGAVQRTGGETSRPDGRRQGHRHRDTAICTIVEGTSEIQRLVIARTLAGVPIR
ncbi:acyl-CoA dehydrogenase family protein [Streptomyces sp. SCSIO 30461]